MGARILICLTLPFAVVWAGTSRVARETVRGFRYAWWDIRGEIDVAKKAWRAKSIREEYWK